MDLKDKWRNLVRQGVVNPDMFPSPEGRSRPRAAMEIQEREAAAAAATGVMHLDAAQVPAPEDGRGPAGDGECACLLMQAVQLMLQRVLLWVQLMFGVKLG